MDTIVTAQIADEIDRRVQTLQAAAAARLDDAEDARRLLSALWPPDGLPPADWWQTPAGRHLAQVLSDEQQLVGQHYAAAVLGVTRGTIAALMSRGRLRRVGRGQLYLGDVLARMLRRSMLRRSPADPSAE